MVRRGWMALAAIVIASGSCGRSRGSCRSKSAPIIAAAIPVIGGLALLGAVVIARPSLGETALAVDAEAGLGDRGSGALELAVAFPASAAASTDDVVLDIPVEGRFDEAAEAARLRPTPAAGCGRGAAGGARPLRPRFRWPAVAPLAAAALLVPALLLPNPQDVVLAQQRGVREAADRQADRLEELAEDLDSKGGEAEDRGHSSQRNCGSDASCVQRPDELALNLRQIGAVESEVRSRIDPSTEQRASAMTSLARSLSRAASGTGCTRRRPGEDS